MPQSLPSPCEDLKSELSDTADRKADLGGRSSSPALQVTEVQQVKLSVVLRVINGVHILETTATVSLIAVTCTV